MLFDFLPKLKICQTSFSPSLFFCGGGLAILACSFPFLSSGSPFVTAEDVVQINIWRHVEHEEWHCLVSEGHTRIMPMTGNTWTVNSCGDWDQCKGHLLCVWGGSRVLLCWRREGLERGMIIWWRCLVTNGLPVTQPDHTCCVSHSVPMAALIIRPMTQHGLTCYSICLPTHHPPERRLPTILPTSFTGHLFLVLCNLNWLYMSTAETIYVPPHDKYPSAIHMAHVAPYMFMLLSPTYKSPVR